MKEIYQLTEKEYNELKALSSLNKKQIDDKATELYNKKGFARIEIDMPEKTYDSEYSYPVSIHPKICTEYNKDAYTLDYKERKKLVTHIENGFSLYITKRCGTYLEWAERLRIKEKSIDNRIKTFLIATITGWFIAIVAVLVVLLS